MNYKELKKELFLETSNSQPHVCEEPVVINYTIQAKLLLVVSYYIAMELFQRTTTQLSAYFV